MLIGCDRAAPLERTGKGRDDGGEETPVGYPVGYPVGHPVRYPSACPSTHTAGAAAASGRATPAVKWTNRDG